MDLNQEQLEQLKAWKEAAALAERWKKIEHSFRLILAEVFPMDKEEGSSILEIQHGWKLKLTRKLAYNLKNSNQEVIALCAVIPDEQAKQLIKWTPDLIVAAYKTLSASDQSLFNGILEIKPGMPTLELIAPEK